MRCDQCKRRGTLRTFPPVITPTGTEQRGDMEAWCERCCDHAQAEDEYYGDPWNDYASDERL